MGLAVNGVQSREDHCFGVEYQEGRVLGDGSSDGSRNGSNDDSTSSGSSNDSSGSSDGSNSGSSNDSSRSSDDSSSGRSGSTDTKSMASGCGHCSGLEWWHILLIAVGCIGFVAAVVLSMGKSSNSKGTRKQKVAHSEMEIVAADDSAGSSTSAKRYVAEVKKWKKVCSGASEALKVSSTSSAAIYAAQYRIHAEKYKLSSATTFSK
jgi:hypothetical protein